jgi:hypothetical protein
MSHKTFYIILFIALFSRINPVCAQDTMNNKWDSEKIRGIRLLPSPAYQGTPLLNKSWVKGTIEFTSGEIADSLFLKYSSYKDDVVYYNATLRAQIIIDKASLNGFSYVDEDNRIHVFRKQYYDGFMSGFRYFEVLSDGETKLLVYRKVDLNTIPAYANANGLWLNMAYEQEYQYYFYSPEKGYSTVKLNQSALINQFAKPDQKPIKKLLRKSKISIVDEASFTRAWKVAENAGYKVIF